MHQLLAQAAALQLGPDDDPELRAEVVGVGDRAHHADRVLGSVGGGLGRNEGDLARVVDLGQPRELAVLDAAAAVEDAHAQILGIERAEEFEVLGFVLGPDRTQRDAVPLPLDRLDQVRRVGQDREARRTRRCIGAGADAGVQRDRAPVVDKQRVDIELGDLGYVGEQLRHCDQHGIERVAVGRRHVAVTVDQLRHARARHQGPCQRCVQRRQGHGAIGQHLDCGAAGTEQDDRTEGGVDTGADDQFARARRLDHRLYREAVDPRIGPRAAHAREHRSCSVAHGLVRIEVERHAADVGLVRDVGRQDLQRDRQPDRLRGLDRCFAVGRDAARRDHRDPA